MRLLKTITSSFKNAIPPDVEKLRKGVRDAYSAAARQPETKHPFPVGRKFAEDLGYSGELLDTIPQIAYEAFVGVSNVSVFAVIPAGSVVLDIGCGAGLDSLIAARKTGPPGRCIGVDFSEEMLIRAELAVKEAHLEGITQFHCAAAENLPIGDHIIDIVLVNGIFNLNPKRAQVFREIARVLREDGKVFAAELVLTGPVSQGRIRRLDDWFS